MFKLGRYFKPFVGVIILCVVILFGQAFCDLSLPDYMSNIVNVGIQQNGVETAVPEAVRASQMDKMTIFMSSSNKTEVLKDYTLINKNSSDYNKYLSKYPDLSKEPIYVLNSISTTETNKLNPIMGKAFLTVDGINKMKSTAKNGFINLNGQMIPAKTDLFALFTKLPQSEISKISNSINNKFTALGDSMITQAAAGLIKNEYAALGMNTNKIQSDYIFKTGFLMLALALGSAIATITVSLLASRVAAGMSKNLRSDLFKRVEKFSNNEFDKFSTASLLTRTTNDITQIQNVIVMIIRMVIYAPILGVGGVIKALGKSTSMSWIIALAVVLLLGLMLSVFAVAIPKFKSIQKLIDKLNLVTRENLSGMMVIRAFNTQNFEENRFDKANNDLTSTNLFVSRLMSVLMPAMMFIMNGTMLLVVWVGAHKISESSMQVGDMMAFMQYAMQIIFAFLMLSMMFIFIPRASVSAVRVIEVIDTDLTILDPKKPKKFNDKFNSTVEFKNVCFRYDSADEDAIKNVTFTAKPGETTAIIGSTGSGKTTLINLIPRFYDITGGEILIDGVNIKDVTQHELRDKIGYIPQKGSLFKGTIESNLKYANENASEEDLNKASEIAQAMEFISEKPEGYQTEIAQGGGNVSGGQKQRLSIARALVKKPEIFIFDDSFSALDFKTDAKLRKALKSETENSTVIIVAQRISTIMNAEQILVLDEGKIVGKGTHEELMENCETYKEIALSQLSKEELA